MLIKPSTIEHLNIINLCNIFYVLQYAPFKTSGYKNTIKLTAKCSLNNKILQSQLPIE